VTVPAASVVIAPTTGPPGTAITVSGSGFGANELIDVYFDATPMTLAVADGSGSFAGAQIFVPSGAPPGSHTVVAVGRQSTRAGQVSFTVTPPAAPALSLTPTSGAPKSKIVLSGSGFGANESVDLYFDTADLALVTTNGSGGFSAITLTVPASALPGEHWVTASGRQSGRSTQAMFLVQADWAGFRNGPRHKGLNALENVLSPSTVDGLDVDWQAATGDNVFSSPAVASGVVYVGSADGRLYAFDAGSGAPVWSVSTGGSVRSSPAVANGVVYVGADDSKLYAFNAASGAPLWNAAIGSQGFSSPAVANGVVYVGSADGKLYAFNAASGAPLWNGATGSSIYSSPAVANGVVYVGSDDWKLYAFNAVSGAPLWSAATGDGIRSSPTVANGVVYIGSNDGKLYAFNAGNGFPLWNATTGGSLTYTSPAVAKGVVFVASNDGKLYAFNAASGAPLWNVILGATVYSSPAVANGVVYIASYNPGTLYALNASSGAQLWNATTGSAIFSSPAVANGVVYIGSIDKKLYAYDLTAPPIPTGLPDPNRLMPNLMLRPQYP